MEIFQNLFGKISAGEISHDTLLIAFTVVALALIIFSLDKPKAIFTLLFIYGAVFVALQFSGAETWLEKRVSTNEMRYGLLIVQSLPILALLVLKFKGRR